MAAFECSDNSWDDACSATARSLAETFSASFHSDDLARRLFTADSEREVDARSTGTQDADEGVGLVIRRRERGDTTEALSEIVVEDILPGSPADLLTDIRGGDSILTVSNVRVEGLPVSDVMRLIRVGVEPCFCS